MYKDNIEYSQQMIFDAIEVVFTSTTSPALYHYYEKDHIWEAISKAIKDEDFMRVVIYNNDYLSVAPVHTFCAYFIDDKVELSTFEKNSIGRIFKFVFNVLGYEDSIRVYRKKSSVKYGKVFIK